MSESGRDVVWPLMSNNITSEDRNALIDFLHDDNRLTHGKKVEEFEKRWSDWLGVSYSVFVNSGASANDISMHIVRQMFGEGEVIVPPLTWVSDISSIIHAKLTPVFVDINSCSLGLDSKEIKKKINKNTKAIFLTHILGLNGMDQEIRDISIDEGIPIIEDVCESHGAKWKNQKLGTFGLMSNFSFYYAHHMTTIEGGMICTNSEEVYNFARMFRSHGMTREVKNDEFRLRVIEENPDLNPDFIFYVAAHNMRPTELGAVVGISQLPRLDSNIERRNRNFDEFLAELDPNRFKVDFFTEGCSNYALILVLRNPDLTLRDKVENVLRENGIEFRRGLSGGGNQIRQPYIKRLNMNLHPEQFPNADFVHHFGWYIGNYPDLEISRIKNLCRLVNNC